MKYQAIFTRSILLLFVFCIQGTLALAQWQTVGNAGFTPGKGYVPVIGVYKTTPYVAFTDVNNGEKVRVMTYKSGQWQTLGDTALSAGKVNYLDLEIIDSVPYIAYLDQGNGKFTVRKYDGIEWDTVGSPGFVSNVLLPSLYSNNGTPYIIYNHSLQGERLCVMKFNGSEWESVGNLYISLGKSFSAQMAFVGDTPYVSYSDQALNYKACVKKLSGSEWVSVGANGFSPARADQVSIASDGNTVYVAFTDYSISSKASVMKFNGSAWVYVGSAGFSAGTSAYNNLYISNGSLYLAYGENIFTTAVKKFDGSYWNYLGTANISGGVANSITAASSGNIHYVCYTDNNAGTKVTVKKYEEGVLTGLAESENYPLQLFPNPVQDKIHIQAAEPIQHVEVYNVTGTLLEALPASDSEVEINMSAYPQGYYVVKVKSGSGILTRQILRR